MKAIYAGGLLTSGPITSKYRTEIGKELLRCRTMSFRAAFNFERANRAGTPRASETLSRDINFLELTNRKKFLCTLTKLSPFR